MLWEVEESIIGPSEEMSEAAAVALRSSHRAGRSISMEMRSLRPRR